MKQEIREALKNKNIILFGLTEETVLFYEKYAELLNICYCVTNYSEKVTLQPMEQYGLETKLYDDVVVTPNDYFILCDSALYPPCERRLQMDGFAEYKDYVSLELAMGVLEEKKIVVFMGPYVMGQVVEGLKLQPEIVENYYCTYYAENQLLKPYRNRIMEYRHIVKICDIYVTSVCDRNMYEAKIVPDEMLMLGCKRIKVSGVGFDGYFPQLGGGEDQFSWFLYRERERKDISYETLVLAREDRNLVRFIEDNVPVKEIVKLVSDDEFYSKEQVLGVFFAALDRLRKVEQDADIQLADLIEKKVRDKIAYRNLDEWNLDIVKYVIERLASMMGIFLDDIDELELTERIVMDSGSELPVYPSVLKHLGIVGYTEKKYKVVNYYRTQYLEFKAYIEYMAECMYQIKRMNEFLGIEGEKA